MFSFFRRAPATDTMSLSEQSVLDSLRQFADPNTGKDYVSSRAVKNLRVSGADVSFDIELGYPAKTQVDGIRQALIAQVKSVAGVGNVSVNVFSKIVAHAVQQREEELAAKIEASRQMDLFAMEAPRMEQTGLDL